MDTRRRHIPTSWRDDAHGRCLRSWRPYLTDDQPHLGCQDSTVPAIRHKYFSDRQQTVSRDDGWTGQDLQD